MRIVLVSGKYLPDKSAGIENYTHWLAKVLMQNGHRVDVAILESKNMEGYSYESVNVFLLKKGFQSFIRLIQDNHYDICHFQEYSGENGINMDWIRIAKGNCKKVFFTFHLPYLTCYKNDFRYLGIEDCNTFNSPERCVKCIIATKLNYRDTNQFNAYNAGIKLITPVIEKTGFMKKVRSRIKDRQEDLKELLKICDKVFLIADWFKEILIANGYDFPSMVKIPSISMLESQEISDHTIQNKIIFIGRIEKEKGLHILCKAMKIISAGNIRLDVFGNKVNDGYFSNCRNEYAFNYKESLDHSELMKLLPQYDFLVLPSLFTEMFPLVIQEAFMNKVPVIASAAKGNVDAIEEGRNGFIFRYGDQKDLARVIDKAYHLKQKGWQPEFETKTSSESDLQEILSYYSPNSITSAK